MGSVDRLNHSNHQPSQPTSKMKTIFVLACLATVTLAQIQKAADSSAEACDCQCSSLTFRDTRGRVQGSCKTTYNGAQLVLREPKVHQVPRPDRLQQVPRQVLVLPGLCYP